MVVFALVNRGGCVALITALGEKGDLPHPIALDYAAAGTWLQGHQTRRLNSKSHNRLGRINTSGILTYPADFVLHEQARFLKGDAV